MVSPSKHCAKPPVIPSYSLIENWIPFWVMVYLHSPQGVRYDNPLKAIQLSDRHPHGFRGFLAPF